MCIFCYCDSSQVYTCYAAEAHDDGYVCVCVCVCVGVFVWCSMVVCVLSLLCGVLWWCVCVCVCVCVCWRYCVDENRSIRYQGHLCGLNQSELSVPLPTGPEKESEKASIFMHSSGDGIYAHISTPR